MEFIKSPFNYIGNKYRIVQQLTELFPRNIRVFVDLFCGGCDIAINTQAERILANDINYHLVDILRTFKHNSPNAIFKYIDSTIAKWGLTKTDKAAYEQFREHYNRTKNPLDLFILICHSFNHQFRFNEQHEFNTPFGCKRSSYNHSIRSNLEKMLQKLNNIVFTAVPFDELDMSFLTEKDFVYADPPYLLTCGSYNDGKRGFKGWTARDDARLLGMLSSLHARGVRFGLSNVLEHKGRRHAALEQWARNAGHGVYDMGQTYANCNYHARHGAGSTREVYISNC